MKLWVLCIALISIIFSVNGQEKAFIENLEHTLEQETIFQSEVASVRASSASAKASLLIRPVSLTLSARSAYQINLSTSKHSFPMGITVDIGFQSPGVLRALSSESLVLSRLQKERNNLFFNEGAYRGMVLAVQKAKTEAELDRLTAQLLSMERSFAAARGLREQQAREALFKADNSAELIAAKRELSKVTAEAEKFWNVDVPDIEEIEEFLSSQLANLPETLQIKKISELSLRQFQVQLQRKEAESFPIALSAWLGGDVSLPEYENPSLTIGFRMQYTSNRSREKGSLEAFYQQLEAKRKAAKVAEEMRNRQFEVLQGDIEMLKAQLELAEEAIEASRELTILTEERLSAGAASMNDLVSAKEALDLRYSRKNDLYFEMIFKQIELFKLISPLEIPGAMR